MKILCRFLVVWKDLKTPDDRGVCFTPKAVGDSLNLWLCCVARARVELGVNQLWGESAFGDGPKFPPRCRFFGSQKKTPPAKAADSPGACGGAGEK